MDPCFECIARNDMEACIECNAWNVLLGMIYSCIECNALNALIGMICMHAYNACFECIALDDMN